MSRSNVATGIRAGYYSGPLAATGTGGQPARMRRACPKCGAEPGWKCRRRISERVKQVDGVGRWAYLKTTHQER